MAKASFLRKPPTELDVRLDGLSEYGPDAPTYALWGMRTRAFMFDLLVTFAFPLTMAIVAAIVHEATTGPNGETSRYLDFLEVVPFLSGAMIVGLWVWNRVLRQGRTGQSLGKSLLRLQVVDHHVRRTIGPGRTLLRELCHVLDLFLYLGFLRPLWHVQRKTFADQLAQSIVTTGRPGVRPRERWKPFHSRKRKPHPEEEADVPGVDPYAHIRDSLTAKQQPTFDIIAGSYAWILSQYDPKSRTALAAYRAQKIEEFLRFGGLGSQHYARELQVIGQTLSSFYWPKAMHEGRAEFHFSLQVSWGMSSRYKRRTYSIFSCQVGVAMIGTSNYMTEAIRVEAIGTPEATGVESAIEIADAFIACYERVESSYWRLLQDV